MSVCKYSHVTFTVMAYAYIYKYNYEVLRNTYTRICMNTHTYIHKLSYIYELVHTARRCVRIRHCMCFLKGYIYIYIYIYMCVCVCVCVCAYVFFTYLCLCAHMGVDIHACAFTMTHSYSHTHSHTRTHTHTHIQIDARNPLTAIFFVVVIVMSCVNDYDRW